MRLTLVALAACFSLFPFAFAAEPPAGTYAVGVAQIDITPTYPVRLSGFAARKTESEGVTQKIWAKALAIDDGAPAVIVTVDNLGIPAAIAEEVAARLEKKAGLRRDRFAVTATHTHTAPMLKGVAPTLFGMPIPKEHQEHIGRYTTELTDKLEKVALAALEDRKPALLRWGVGRVGFSMNRRTKGGPVDQDLPVLVVQDLTGKVRAVYVNYACHCVTLSNNKVSGDWAGFAQERIQDDFPGAIALVSVGCGADSNPSSGVTGDKVEIASRQGAEIAAEVQRVAGGFLAPVTGKITASLRRFELPLADLPTREQWEAKAKRTDAIGYHARVNLDRLDRKEALRTKIDYSVQTWSFGDALAMVFLPGEVVVDYSLRLKRELDGLRLWVNAYANDAPCYIPSERVLKEGGYEGGGAMVYYDVPVPLRPGLEQTIIDAVHQQIGQRFGSPFDSKKVAGTRPLSPQQSLTAIHTKPGLMVELVAAEPLVSSPVAIDWGPDGRLWVAEMADYPSGTRGDYKPGGRIVVLEDTHGNGRYDKATVFLDNIPFPTGVTVWRKGVLVSTAPDILYAEDTDGDGKADVVKTLYSGFGTGNYQARVNSLEYGLDGWVHGSCGLYGGQIRTLTSDKPFALGDRDFRIRPDTGAIEPATGRTQQGRVRDDWDNWFGCDNSMLCRHYPLPDHYLRRNPHVAPPPAFVNVTDYADWKRLYPAKPDLQLLPRSGPPNQVTAACGLGVYRDDLLGKEYTGDAFVCEPVNLVVHRMKLTPRDSTFSSRRTPDEAESEFLGTTDNWCRFVQARTGPDGALWIVDIYRYIIEHPRWIPPEEQARMDLRAGSTMGRIYRVRPKDASRPMPRLDKLDTAGLVAALDGTNGWQRDLAGQILLWKQAEEAVPALEKLAEQGRPEGRLHALCVLDVLGRLRLNVLLARLADPHPGVRRHAVRLLEKHAPLDRLLGNLLPVLLKDGDAQVRLQLAFTLGAWRDPRAGKALASLLLAYPDDAYLRAAALSSVRADNLAEVFDGVLPGEAGKAPPEVVVRSLTALAGAMGVPTLPRVLRDVTTPRDGQFAPWQMAGLAGLLDALDRNGRSLDQVADEAMRGQVGRMLTRIRATAADDKAPETDRLAALPFLGRDAKQRDADLELLGKLLVPQNSADLQTAATAALGRIADERVPALLTAGWKAHTPALKSQILDLLLSRAAWQRQLLDFLEKKVIAAADVDATRRQRLLAHRDATLRDRAAKLFDGAVNPDRQKVVDAYKDVATLAGDVPRGKAVFAKSCAVCHSLEGVGHSVGPDLRTVMNKTPLYLLTEILDPNRNVDSRYVSYVALTRAGRTFTGLLASESATSITLRGQEGKDQVLLRGELEEFLGTGKSLMPEGLEKELTRQDLTDLISYLTVQDAPPKQFPGNEPAVVKPVDGALALLAANGAIYGREITFEPQLRNVGMWHGVEDRVLWNIRLDKPGAYDVWLDWSCADDSAGNAFVLEGVLPELRGKVAATGGWDRYRQEKIGTVNLSIGAHRLILRPDGGKLNRALMDLRGLHFVPKGQMPKLSAEQPKTEDPAELARQILDDKLPAAKRQEIIDAHPDKAADVVAALVAKAKADGKGESGSVPGVWRVAIAAGKRNDTGQLRRLLDVSLPKGDDPLREWQAVVIGGGVVNGISLQGAWPRPRIDEILKDDTGLQERWRKALAQAPAMADNEKVSTGTRYDALRMIAVDDFGKHGDQLAKYLAKGIHDELQMGAISGLSDMESPKVAELLLAGMGHYSPGNRKLALDALLRTEARTAALLDAMEQGKVKPDQLSEVQVIALREHKDEKLRARAEKVLPR